MIQSLGERNDAEGEDDMTDATGPDLPAPLAALHARARAQGWLRRFTMANRLLLAIAFLPTGMVKALGHRFTTLPVENPIGFFFEAMYRTGLYWQFIGCVQVLAAVLLLIPRTACLGALLFTPIAVSVFLVTVGMGFQGTAFVTGAMLLSVVYLLCWDADRIWAAVAPLLRPVSGGSLLRGMHPLESVGWLLGGAAGIGVFLATRNLLPVELIPMLLVAGAAAVLLVIIGWVFGALRSRSCARSFEVGP